MKAVMRTQYGPPDVLRFAETPMPAPAEDEVLIQLCAASVNPLDLFMMRGAPWNRLPGMRTPKDKVLGCDIAGRVDALGRKVTRFQVGDEVFGATGFHGRGFAEYVCVTEQKLAHKPANLSFVDAASVPVAGCTALQGLRDQGQLRPGQTVLIEGASGGVGTFAVQIAKALGAEVTAVCSPRNVTMACTLGADHVIDYTQADFAKSGKRYDLVLAANGRHSLVAYRRVLKPNGIYVAAGGRVGLILQVFLLGPLLTRAGSKKMGFFLAKMEPADLAFLSGLIDAGKVKPVIDRCYPLAEAAEALRYLAEGHAQGKVILTC
jgi:NADPH:quinone reductase-like Zn-dependent oxidoreductase